MARRPARPSRPRTRRSPRQQRANLTRFLPGASARRRLRTAVSVLPGSIQLALVVGLICGAWFLLNGLYQVVRKPSELFFPVSGALHKTPRETWESYGPLFRKHATATITPEFLAALAQVEGSGNPVVRTYWRWSWRAELFDVYRPASSAVGMYQITNGTFEEAKRYCIHDHGVVTTGPWNDWSSCWFNALYTRTIPSHAVEMTAAYLDRQVSLALARFHVKSATLEQRQNLAALIHLCGAAAGNAYVRRGLKLAPGQRCGDHDARGYLARVNSMKATFYRLKIETSA